MTVGLLIIMTVFYL